MQKCVPGRHCLVHFRQDLLTYGSYDNFSTLWLAVFDGFAYYHLKKIQKSNCKIFSLFVFFFAKIYRFGFFCQLSAIVKIWIISAQYMLSYLFENVSGVSGGTEAGNLFSLLRWCAVLEV